METTVGQLLINNLLPEDMRDYDRVLDKKTVQKVFTELADRYPDRYAEISQKFHTLASQTTARGGKEASFSLDSFRAPKEVLALRGALKSKVDAILDSNLPEDKKDEAIITTISEAADEIGKANFDFGMKNNNPLALQVASGSRGNQMQFRSLTAGDLMTVDHKSQPIPIPMLSSYAEGLDPVQYWAGSYGARKGLAEVKFATPKGGFLGKQLALATHRLVITEPDCGTQTGISVPADDGDNSGALLATDIDGYKRGTILTPEILREVKGDILVRSPMTCEANHGICQRCAGIRERGGFSPIGDVIGIAAAQAVAEPISQGMLGSKHVGGVVGGKSGKSGLDLINQMVQVPKTFQGGAAIAQVDGKVEKIVPAPQGGFYVQINKQNHWMAGDQDAKVKVGDEVEAGDVLSSGVPNPALIVQHKGIGEGRRYFMGQLRDALNESGFGVNRRNLELISRGLINHVRITEPYGPRDTIMDDLVEYDYVTRDWQPRVGSVSAAPSIARGKYLEKPALSYSIGTRVTPRIAKALQAGKIKDVLVHNDPPPFAPEMTRAMETLAGSEDWMVQLGGFHLKKNFLEGVHRSKGSDPHGTSFIPALALGMEFGKDRSKGIF
jgi:DNA-directed RNA polymerase subunit beta'